MKTIGLALLILIAIWAWPVTVACLVLYFAFKLIEEYIKMQQKKKYETKIRNVAPSYRLSLEQDSLAMVSLMVQVVKKHWNVLEDKFDYYIQEDDYGNLFIHKSFKKELIYFSQKVVLSELKDKIEQGDLKSIRLDSVQQDVNLSSRSDYSDSTTREIIFLLHNMLYVLKNIPSDYYGIKLEDTDEDIAKKLMRNTSINASISDEFLYDLYTDPSIRDRYVNSIAQAFMHDAAFTVEFPKKFDKSTSLIVPPFVALVFVIFSALYNNRTLSKPVKNNDIENFYGNDPYKYEEFIKELLRSDGYEARRTRSSGDFGVDVLAYKSGKSFSVQCKLYNRPVGTKVIQEIVSGRIFYNTDFAIVVTDNSFTPAAKTLAQKSDVLLVHHRNLLNKLNNLIEGSETNRIN